MTALEEFFYGSLRSMDDEYLERTLKKLDPEVDYLEWIHQNGVGDNVYVHYWGGESQSYRKTYRSSLCYEMAELLANEVREPTPVAEEVEEEIELMSKSERAARYRYQYKLNGYSWLNKQPWMYQGLMLEETQV